ncbi:MAG: helix-turn-helix domain-containing protein [Nitriliruptor sp.]|nr:MAG: helix-turn-helix domain-containing protein [Nitriliruptor sp.]
MLTVSPDPARVESALGAGSLVCPSCEAGRVGPWGWARGRPVGRGRRRQRVRPRRGRCRGCDVTHVLLPASMLLRRADWVELIGRALELKAAGLGQRPIAAEVGVSRSTVRGWLSRFAVVAERVRAHLVRWALWLDPGLVRIEPSGSDFGDALVAVAAAGSAAAVWLGIGCRWEFASAATAGRLLCNTTSPFPGPWMG